MLKIKIDGLSDFLWPFIFVMSIGYTLLSMSDPTLMTASVAEVMELVNNWDSLQYSIYIPGHKGVIPVNRFTGIQLRCSTVREIANECASYYVHYHPLSSWTHLATQLYRQGEFAAVEKLKPFLPLRGKCQAISYARYANNVIEFLCMYQ